MQTTDTTTGSDTDTERERWTKAAGYGEYEVSDRGRIRIRIRNRILKTTTTHGRAKVTMTTWRRKAVYVGRLVLESFVGVCPDGFECKYRDGDRSNNRLTNLEWGPKRRAKTKPMRAKFGGYLHQRTNSTLNADLVRRCRADYADGTAIATLAHRHGIPRSTMAAAVTGRSWRHVGTATEPRSTPGGTSDGGGDDR